MIKCLFCNSRTKQLSCNSRVLRVICEACDITFVITPHRNYHISDNREMVLSDTGKSFKLQKVNQENTWSINLLDSDLERF